VCDSTSCAKRTQAHEKDLQRLFLYVAFGIGIAFAIEIAIGGHFDIDADSDPETDSDPGILQYHLYFRGGDGAGYVGSKMAMEEEGGL
jgi:hypothetical protein